jgi:hypothetical protein
MEFVAPGWLGRLPQVLWGRRPCPLCGSIRFVEAESGRLDRLLAVFLLHPIRCENCWRRYYGFAGRT